jgi:DNA-binding IclR family transcriptional regulator
MMWAMRNSSALQNRGRSAPNRNQLIASAASTLEVLEFVGAANGPVTLSAVAQGLGRPKGSVHRMLSTLVNTGYLSQDRGRSGYALTLKLWRVGSAAVGRLDLLKVAGPHLERLMAETDETVHVSVLDGAGNMVYVSKVEAPRSIRVQTQIGRAVPAWCSSTGRVMLAYDPVLADRVLAGPLEKRTEKTVTDPEKIRAGLREAAEKGYAVMRAENHIEMGGIAAPVRDHSGAVVAAVGIGIPVFRMNRALVTRCIPSVVRAAAAISEALGHAPAA